MIDRHRVACGVGERGGDGQLTVTLCLNICCRHIHAPRPVRLYRRVVSIATQCHRDGAPGVHGGRCAGNRHVALRLRIADDVIHRNSVYRQRDRAIDCHRLSRGYLIPGDILRAHHHTEWPVVQAAQRRGRDGDAPATIAPHLRVIRHAIKEHRHWLAGFNSRAVAGNGQVDAFFRRVNDVVCRNRIDRNRRVRLGDDREIAAGGGRVTAGIRDAGVDSPLLIGEQQHIRRGHLHAPAAIALRGGGIRFTIERQRDGLPCFNVCAGAAQQKRSGMLEGVQVTIAGQRVDGQYRQRGGTGVDRHRMVNGDAVTHGVA